MYKTRAAASATTEVQTPHFLHCQWRTSHQHFQIPEDRQMKKKKKSEDNITIPPSLELVSRAQHGTDVNQNLRYSPFTGNDLGQYYHGILEYPCVRVEPHNPRQKRVARNIRSPRRHPSFLLENECLLPFRQSSESVSARAKEKGPCCRVLSLHHRH